MKLRWAVILSLFLASDVVFYMSVIRSALTAMIATVISISAAVTVPGANGKDGAFEPTSNVTVDLSAARELPWTSDEETGGTGVYDSEHWAVVFRYSRVRIPSGVTVTFKNHRSRAPVVWLVSGDVVIEPGGAINLNGAAGGSSLYAEPGPGGFRGGKFELGSGFGVGGGLVTGNWAQVYGGHVDVWNENARTYGEPTIRLLIGGSGGGYTYGGAGGGAMLIAAAGEVRNDGLVAANGGGGEGGGGAAGAGGSIRIIASTLSGTGSWRAISNGSASAGRIRFEASSFAGPMSWNPEPSMEIVNGVAEVFRELPPRTRIISVQGEAAPPDPRAVLGVPPGDIPLPEPGAMSVLIETMNLEPVGASVKLFVIPTSAALGDRRAVAATLRAGGNYARAEWEAPVTLAPGSYAMQVHAVAAP